jgi:hypothetical protein
MKDLAKALALMGAFFIVVPTALAIIFGLLMFAQKLANGGMACAM